MREPRSGGGPGPPSGGGPGTGAGAGAPPGRGRAGPSGGRNSRRSPPRASAPCRRRLPLALGPPRPPFPPLARRGSARGGWAVRGLRPRPGGVPVLVPPPRDRDPGAMDFRGKKYERGSNWSDPEVVELLQLWADESVQMELESCLRNQHVFNRIAEVLREKGIHRTGDQCREKIKKMKLEYRRIKDNSKAPRGGRTWKFYEVMDRVLTSRPALAYSSLSGSMMAQQVLQGTIVESYHHQFPSSTLPFGHSQHPELMEIKCEEVNSDEHCLTPEPPPSMSYQQGSPEEHEMERAFLERAQNDSPISRVEIPIETSVSPSGRDSLLHSSIRFLPGFPERLFLSPGFCIGVWILIFQMSQKSFKGEG